MKDIRIQVTNDCNYSCSYCFKDAGKPEEEEITVKEIIEFLESIIDEVGIVSFTGGEPLIRKDFVYVVNHYLKSHDIPTQIFTNGSLLTPGDLAQGIDTFIIGLDDCREDVNDEARGYYGAMARASEAIERAASHADVWARSTITLENIGNAYNTIQHVQSLGAHKWVGRSLIPHGRGVGSLLSVTPEEWNMFGEQVSSWRDFFSIDLVLNPYCKSVDCEYIRDKSCADILITPTGELKQCAFQEAYGNIRGVLNESRS